ncbi:hypothetical protein [Propionibacterium acidifaciens]|uniref:hypothetical protein n=1 Tax=Propionibacterium acidifaciens TaxID=556499 RepID=UPI0011CDD90F|nr:hypothetical protein [Propionibacterium acidifaciens]
MPQAEQVRHGRPHALHLVGRGRRAARRVESEDAAGGPAGSASPLDGRGAGWMTTSPSIAWRASPASSASEPGNEARP